MLAGKLPTATLDKPDRPAGPVGPTNTRTSATRNRGPPSHQRGRSVRRTPAGDERVERLAEENERLREQVGRERERRNEVVEHYERLLDRRDATSAANGRKRAGDGIAHTADDGPRAVVAALRERVGRLF